MKDITKLYTNNFDDMESIKFIDTFFNGCLDLSKVKIVKNEYLNLNNDYNHSEIFKLNNKISKIKTKRYIKYYEDEKIKKVYDIENDIKIYTNIIKNSIIFPFNIIDNCNNAPIELSQLHYFLRLNNEDNDYIFKNMFNNRSLFKIFYNSIAKLDILWNNSNKITYYYNHDKSIDKIITGYSVIEYNYVFNENNKLVVFYKEYKNLLIDTIMSIVDTNVKEDSNNFKKIKDRPLIFNFFKIQY